MAAAVWFAPSGAESLTAQGARLFDGREPLEATMAGHATPLPLQAARCSQCHAGPAGPAKGNGSGPALPGPLMNGAYLRSALPRRGGPPVVYDRSAFCQTLRSGVDPAHVVLPRTMPRFDIDEVRCVALWTYLTREIP